MCSGLFSSSANGAIASRASACSGLSTSSRIVRSPCTISGLAGLYCMGSLSESDGSIDGRQRRREPTSSRTEGEHFIVDAPGYSRKIGFGIRALPLRAARNHDGRPGLGTPPSATTLGFPIFAAAPQTPRTTATEDLQQLCGRFRYVAADRGSPRISALVQSEDHIISFNMIPPRGDRRVRELERIGSIAEVCRACLVGAIHRLRPKLLTGGAAIISLAPTIWATGVGAEVIQLMSAPVLGGLLIAGDVIDNAGTTYVTLRV